MLFELSKIAFSKRTISPTIPKIGRNFANVTDAGAVDWDATTDPKKMKIRQSWQSRLQRSDRIG
jgi:hypothetical protein